MNKTKIDWTDKTWNPVTGCKHGCPYCYARAISKRFGRSFEPEFHHDRLKEINKIKPGEKIFVCSMADLFGSWVPDEWIESVLMRAGTNWMTTFQFLTKNPERYRSFYFGPNMWKGATATNQAQWDRAMNSEVDFVSCEPLLEPINPVGADLRWIIIGGCTGASAKQPQEVWVSKIEEWAGENGIPVFHKDNLGCRVGMARKEFPSPEMPRPKLVT
ncbi:MAG: DUF5131 family protein [Patescibacteria group bacterium]